MFYVHINIVKTFQTRHLYDVFTYQILAEGEV